MEESNSDKKMYNKIYLKTKINIVLMAIVLLGSLNLGATALGYNFIEMLGKIINTSLKTNYAIDKVIYMIIAGCACWLAIKRTTWLPFLGTGIMPSNLLPIKKPDGANKKITIKTSPNTKIAYWASQSKDAKTDVVDAYGNYSNSGVVMSDASGNAILEIIGGTGYTVPNGRVLPAHVHYRTVGLPNGMMGKVETAKQ
jgi:hypothetical protein